MRTEPRVELNEEQIKIWMQNFGNTMCHIEYTLGINIDSTSPEDRSLHRFLRSVMYNFGKNLSEDLIKHTQERK